MEEKLIEQLLQMVKNGIDFTVGELPEVARQVLEFNYFSNCVWIWVMVGLTVLFGFLLFIGIIVEHLSDTIDCKGFNVLAGSIFLFFLIMAIVSVPIKLVDNYKIKHYPKLYLFDCLQSRLSK